MKKKKKYLKLCDDNIILSLHANDKTGSDLQNAQWE